MTYLVYLAGPIAGCDYAGATDWRNTVSDALYIESCRRIRPLSPMRDKSYLRDVTGDVGFSATCEEYGHLSPLSGPRGIMTRDFFDATRCDLLFVNLLGATRPSIGTIMEIAWAYQKRTPIVVVMEEAGNPHEHCMISEATGFRVSTLEQGVAVALSVLA